jgi:predicted RNA binding protein YcfA (HicA-like mRNA interferase family)
MSRMPQVTALELVRFLKGQGFAQDRQSGSHLTLWHEERKVTLTVPFDTGCDLGRGLAWQIPKYAGFSVDDYIRLR